MAENKDPETMDLIKDMNLSELLGSDEGLKDSNNTKNRTENKKEDIKAFNPDADVEMKDLTNTIQNSVDEKKEDDKKEDEKNECENEKNKISKKKNEDDKKTAKGKPKKNNKKKPKDEKKEEESPKEEEPKEEPKEKEEPPKPEKQIPEAKEEKQAKPKKKKKEKESTPEEITEQELPAEEKPKKKKKKKVQDPEPEAPNEETPKEEESPKEEEPEKKKKKGKKKKKEDDETTQNKKKEGPTKMKKNGKKGKTSKEVVTLEGDPEEIVLNYMIEQNRPYSVINICDNLRGAIKKGQLIKILENLVSEGKLICKEYNSKIYLANQNNYPEISEEELTKLDTEANELKEELAHKREQIAEKKSELNTLLGEYTDEKLRDEIKAKEELLKTLQEKCSKIKNNQIEPIPIEKMEEAEKTYETFKAKYKNLKSCIMDIIGQFSEGMELTDEKVFEIIGIENDNELVNSLGYKP